MSNLVYLLIVVVASGLGVLVLWLRNRPTSSPHASIDEFSEKMRALAPEDDLPDGPGRRPRRGA